MQAFGLAPGNGDGRAALPANLAARSRGEPALAAFRLGLSECFVQLRRVLKDDGRFVFSYQHKTAGAWAALAAALAAGGWRPVQVFPLLGNSTAGLHQHEGTILWDAITVCRKNEQGSTPLGPARRDRHVTAAACHARGWANRPAGCKAARFGDADHANLLRACLVTAALGAFGTRGRGAGRPLLTALEELPAPLS